MCKKCQVGKSCAFDKDLQSMIPRKPVENFVSCIEILSLVPLRMVASELMSFTAASMAILATLPIVELKDKIAPMLTVLGSFVVTFLIPFERNPLYKITRIRSQILLMLYCTANI